MALSQITKGTWYKIFLFACILIACVSCDKPSDERATNFQSFYPKLQQYSNAEYDSLLNFYYQLDSINLEHPSNLMAYLKKMTESRLNYRDGEYVKSNAIIDDALLYVKKDPSLDSLSASCFMSKGINFMMLAKYDSAFCYFYQAEKIYERDKNMPSLCTVYGNMAKTFYNKGDIDKTREYIDKASQDSTYLPLLLRMTHLKANLYGSMGLLDSALLIDKQAIYFYANKGGQLALSSFYNNMAMCFVEKNEMDSALFYYKKSYQADSVCGFQMNMSIDLVLLADIHYQLGDHQQANLYYNRALTIFSKEHSPDKKALVFEVFAKHARNEKRYQQALQWQDSLMLAHQEINDIDINRTIERLQIEYESEKKKQQIEVQERQLATYKMIVVFAVLVLFLLIGLFVLYVQVKRKSAVLQAVEQDKKVLAMRIGMEKTERSRIARDLHDSISQKLAVIQMYISSLSSVEQAKTNEISTLVKDVSAEIRVISHNMFPKDLNKGLVPALQYFCEQSNFVQAHTQFHLTVDNAEDNLIQNENIDFVIYRIVQEISNNALKYAQAKHIYIIVMYSQSLIKIRIHDDGLGFDTSLLETTKGAGLKNIFERVKQLNGKIDLTSNSDEGTLFSIEIPTV